MEPRRSPRRTRGAIASRPSVPGQGRDLADRYYQDIAVERVLEAIADGAEPHPADARDGHRQDIHRIPDRMEAVSDAAGT